MNLSAFILCLSAFLLRVLRVRAATKLLSFEVAWVAESYSISLYPNMGVVSANTGSISLSESIIS